MLCFFGCLLFCDFCILEECWLYVGLCEVFVFDVLVCVL